jgi:hypothetical protein
VRFCWRRVTKVGLEVKHGLNKGLREAHSGADVDGESSPSPLDCAARAVSCSCSFSAAAEK